PTRRTQDWFLRTLNYIMSRYATGISSTRASIALSGTMYISIIVSLTRLLSTKAQLTTGWSENCRVNSIRLNESDSEVRREYAPVRIVHLLRSLGVEVADSPHEMEPVPVVT